MNYKYEPIILLEKNINIVSYTSENSGSSNLVKLNVTDREFPNLNTNSPSILHRFNEATYMYNFTDKIAKGKMTQVQLSLIYDYQITAIRCSLKLDSFDIKVDMVTFDVGQIFLNMDDSAG